MCQIDLENRNTKTLSVFLCFDLIVWNIVYVHKIYIKVFKSQLWISLKLFNNYYT